MDIPNKTKKTNTGGGPAKEDPPKKLSGAARRKLRKEKIRQEQGGKTGPRLAQLGDGSTPKANLPGTSKGPQGSYQRQGVKRDRSEGSTPEGPKKCQQPKKRGRVSNDPGTSYAAALKDTKIAILPHGYPETSLSESQGELIKNALINALDEIAEGQQPPRFSGVYFRGGFLLASCADQATKEWLERMVEKCVPWEGAKLSVCDAKDIPKPIRALVWIPGPIQEPEKTLRRLRVQNPGLQTSTWTVVDRKPDPKGQQLILMVDEASWRKIEELQCRPYFNLTRVFFKALGRKKDLGEQMEVEEDQGTQDGPRETEGDREDQL